MKNISPGPNSFIVQPVPGWQGGSAAMKWLLCILLCTCSSQAAGDDTAFDFAKTASLGSRGRAVHVADQEDNNLIAVVVLRTTPGERYSRKLARGQAELILEKSLMNYVILSPHVGKDWQAVANELSRRDGGFSTAGTLGPGVAYRTLEGLPGDRFAMEATTTIDNISPGKRPAQAEIDKAHRRVILGDMLAGRDRSSEDISRVLDDIKRMIDVSGGEPSRMPPRKLAIMAALVHVQSGDLEAAKYVLEQTGRADWDLDWIDLEQLAEVERRLGNAAAVEAIDSALEQRESTTEGGIDPRLGLLSKGGLDAVPVGTYAARIGDQQWLLAVAEVIEMDFRDGEPGWLRPALRSQVEVAFKELVPAVEYEWRIGGLVETGEDASQGLYDWRVIEEIDKSTPDATWVRYLLATRQDAASSPRTNTGATIEVNYRGAAPGLSSAHEAVREGAWRQLLAGHFKDLADLLGDNLPPSNTLDVVFPALNYMPSEFGRWVVDVDMSAARERVFSLLPPGSIELTVAVSPWTNPDSEGVIHDPAWVPGMRECIAERLESWPAVRVVEATVEDPPLAVITIGAVDMEEGELPSRYAGNPPRHWSMACREISISFDSTTSTALACTERQYGSEPARVTPALAMATAAKLLEEMDLGALQQTLLAKRTQ